MIANLLTFFSLSLAFPFSSLLRFSAFFNLFHLFGMGTALLSIVTSWCFTFRTFYLGANRFARIFIVKKSSKAVLSARRFSQLMATSIILCHKSPLEQVGMTILLSWFCIYFSIIMCALPGC